LNKKTYLVKKEAAKPILQREYVLSKNANTKPKNVNYFQVPNELWERVKHLIPQRGNPGGRGRPAADNRAILNGIWYVMWTGCQWKAVHRSWFGVSSSVLHAQFQAWREQGIFEAILKEMVLFYAQQRGIGWEWQSIDSKSCPAPLGGEKTGKNPTDRGKLGAKIHVLVDQFGAPLAVHITGANQHDKWSADDLIFSIVVERPDPQHLEQHFCADKGYDYDDVHLVVEQQLYTPHIKHRRRRNEPKPVECPIPGETQYPARRWVVERTFSWLVKRRSIRTRWCKKVENWLALVLFACAHIVFNLAFFG
jgi:putative transposase